MSIENAEENSQAPTEPNQTIYIRNLNEKVRKDELKRNLYAICSEFGPILDVICVKTLKMRGQAFVVFKNIKSAIEAINKLDGFLFFDKRMQVEFAKEKSDIISKLEGTFDPEISVKRKELKESLKKRRAEEIEKQPHAKRDKRGPKELNPPSNVLLVQGFPEDFSDEELSNIFNKFKGLKSIKVARAGLAFAIFESEPEATEALQALQEHEISPENNLSINYAKT